MSRIDLKALRGAAMAAVEGWAKLAVAAVDQGKAAGDVSDEMSVSADVIITLLDLLESVEMERDALRKDAERYRWLRRPSGNNRVPHVCQYPCQSVDTERVLQINEVGMDAAIDQAMGKDEVR